MSNLFQTFHDEIKVSLGESSPQFENPREHQENLLLSLLNRNRETQIGRTFRFHEIKSAREYCDRLPILSYSEIQPAIDRIAGGASHVLTEEKVLFFEQTGGSTSGSKLIPYTKSGLEAFQAALLPWLDNLLTHRPKIKEGTTYWSISPIARSNLATRGGVPIGIENDAFYFGPKLAEHILGLLSVPPWVASATHPEDWRYLTLRFLLADSNLSLVSVWSPSFLLELLRADDAKSQDLFRRIADNVEVGFIETPNGAKIVSPNPKRADLIREATRGQSVNTELLWPKLDTLSCWLDAGASRFRSDLEALFPHVYLQAKGLLATEGVVSYPLCDLEAPVLSIASGFYEFLKEGSTRTFLSDELSLGEDYRLILTNQSGFYRYDLGDRVRIRGWHKKTPILEFLGRDNLTSDLCGEKLTEPFVLQKLKKLRLNPRTSAFLAPTLKPSPHYELFIESGEESLERLSDELDQGLSENPQYAYARHLGQLGRVAVRVVPGLLDRYHRYHVRRGQKLGEIKPPVLRPETDWSQRMEVRG